MTCFRSWLSDAEADGSGQNCKAGRMLHWPRPESREEEEEEEGV